MRLSQGFIPTLKEIPSDALIPSHQLMLRAGMIRPLGSGVYSFLPLGYRLMKKVVEIVRDEMDAIGGQEFHLPALNPVELWEETGRVAAFGETMFHIKNRPLVLAPTHEEVICSIAKGFVKSYRDMPQIWYQVQTKFRNEPRPRSGWSSHATAPCWRTARSPGSKRSATTPHRTRPSPAAATPSSWRWTCRPAR